MNATPTSASWEAQNDLPPLSGDNASTHEIIPETGVPAVQNAMNSRVDSVIEPTSSPDALPYFELAGHRLERYNHGTPNCPDIALNENERVASWTKPQAWSKEIDGQEHWFYNYPGTCAEAEFLGKEVPTIDQWMEMFASVEWDAVQKAEILNMPMAGYRNADDGKFYNAGDYAYVWSSSPKGDGYAHCAFLKRGNADAFRNWSFREFGMSLRFLADKK